MATGFAPTNTEFRVNSFTSFGQDQSSVTNLADGGFVVTWKSYTQDNSGVGVYGQRYDANGLTVGPEFQINSYSPGIQQRSAVAGLDAGGFVVIWESDAQDGSGYGIYGQRYTAAGLADGAEFSVNTFTVGAQEFASVSGLGDGGFLVAWESQGQDGAGKGIYAQRYSDTGVPVGAEFQVNSHIPNSQHEPSVTDLAGGGFVITWTSQEQDGDHAGVFGQRYDVSGVAVGAEFRINTYTTSIQRHPSVADLADGGFVVAWMSYGQGSSGSDIFGQRYNAAGAPVGAEFQIDTYAMSGQNHPSVTGLADGGFVVAWHSPGQDGSDAGIFGQRYDSSGAAVGSEEQINTYTTNNQEYAAISSLDNGGFVVTWTSDDQDGSSLGVYGQQYDARLFGTSGGDTVIDTVGANWIDGQAGNDTLRGREGNDDIFGGAGADTLAGNGGNDTLNGDSGNDRLFGGAGDDDLNGDNGNDRADGGAGGDILRGGNGDDLLYGRAGIDTLAGNDGADTLYGGGDNDRLYGGKGDDDLNGGSNNDFISGGADNDVLRGNSGDDDLNGNSGADTLAGNDGADDLDGGTGNDRLFGGSGDDLLAGGSGDDSLHGGTGADEFVFTTLAGLDTVQDFNDGTDLIRYDGGVYSDLTIVASGSDVDITSVSGGHMLLLNEDVADITEADFVFV